MSDPADVALVELAISDPPERWAALGFAVSDDGRLVGDGIRGTLGIAPPGRGIVGWTLAGLPAAGDIDGLPTRRAARPRSAWWGGASNPNRATAVDHVVIVTPDLDRLATILERRGLGLTRRRRVRDRAMGFRRLAGDSDARGPVLEVFEASEAPATAFWGVTFAVARPEALDLLAASNRLVGDVHPAVQPRRRIAGVSREAGLSTRVAFIDPDPA